MRNRKPLFALFVAGLLATHLTGLASAANSGDPASVNMKIYKMWVSPNTACTDASLVYNDASPSYQDMVSNPTLGTGSIGNGTFPCVVFKMSDVITGKPDYTSTDGNCTPSTNITIDVFRSPTVSTCPDGTGATGSGTDGSPIEDAPCLYMSTSGSSGNEGWNAASPFPLNGAFVVSGAVAGTFVADFRGQIIDDGSSCGIMPPAFGFR